MRQANQARKQCGLYQIVSLRFIFAAKIDINIETCKSFSRTTPQNELWQPEKLLTARVLQRID
jgi:hypothetical protein